MVLLKHWKNFTKLYQVEINYKNRDFEFRYVRILENPITQLYSNVETSIMGAK